MLAELWVIGDSRRVARLRRGKASYGGGGEAEGGESARLREVESLENVLQDRRGDLEGAREAEVVVHTVIARDDADVVVAVVDAREPRLDADAQDARGGHGWRGLRRVRRTRAVARA